MDTGANKLPRVDFMFIKIVTEFHVVDEIRRFDGMQQIFTKKFSWKYKFKIVSDAIER